MREVILSNNLWQSHPKLYFIRDENMQANFACRDNSALCIENGNNSWFVGYFKDTKDTYVPSNLLLSFMGLSSKIPYGHNFRCVLYALIE